VTIDPAGTSADRARERRGRPASWTVLAVWDQPLSREVSSRLLLRHVVRRQVGFDGLCSALVEVHRQWRPQRMLIENEKLGRAACDVLRGRLPLECIATGGRDKVTRAAPLISKLERGEIFLPRTTGAWLADLEAEWLAWTGLDDETSDQIDAAAYAAQYAERVRPPARALVWPIVVR
jgi:phage terminase large subunit-like protein